METGQLIRPFSGQMSFFTFSNRNPIAIIPLVKDMGGKRMIFRRNVRFPTDDSHRSGGNKQENNLL